MSLVVAWLVFPLVLGLLSLGCGLLLERAAGIRIPRELLLPLGFAVIVVVSLFLTTNSTTARLTTPVVVALAVAGLGLAFPWRPARSAGWMTASAAATFAAFGAPVILSGSATFAGYLTLDDTATWLAFADRLLEHGRNLTGLAPSSYEATLYFSWSGGGYPAGAFPPLGVMHELLGQDSAWLFQPYVAFLGALLAFGLYGLLGRVIHSAPIRALAAFVAAQSSLLYAYSLWGGVKEMASVGLIVLVAALAPAALRHDTRARGLLPLAAATAALIGVLSFYGSVWIAAILIAALAAGLRLRGLAFIRVTAAFAAFAVVLSIPALLLVRDFFDAGTATLTSESELGNLIHPLSALQIFGIWPAGDFRHRPENIDLIYVLIAAVAVAALAGLAWAWRSREWGLLLYVAGTAAGCAATVIIGSPWVDGKAFAIASPAALVAAMAGIGWLGRSGRRVEAAAVLLVISGGVLWSNVLAYHDVWLAPRSQLRELETIGKQFSGDGPALTNEYSPYGSRHFLRHLDPESASELRRRQVLLRDGGVVPKLGYADVDRFELGEILVYRTLVPVRNPSASRPPSVYQRVSAGRYYEVWQRPEVPAVRIIEHLSLGNGNQPAAVPPCREVLRLGRVASAANGRLAAVVRPAVTVVNLSSAVLPAGWRAVGDSSGAVVPSPSGSLESTVAVAAAGRYELWVAGSFRRLLELSVDGVAIASAQHHLNHEGVDTPLGEVALTAGAHRIVLRYSAANLSPGSGGTPFALGPVFLNPDTAGLPVTYLQPSAARSLCGKRLDWIEALGT
jgi:hypothetical protein